MNEDNEDTEALRQIAKLRVMCRGLLVLIVFLGALFALFLWVDLSRAKTELRAEQFVLLDHSHKPVARLRNEGSGACLDLNAESKTTGVTICAADQIGSYVSLTNRGGETRAIVSAGINLSESMDQHYPPGLIVSTANGQKTFAVSVGEESKLILGDSLQKNTFVLVIPSGGQPWIGLKYNGTDILLKANAKGN